MANIPGINGYAQAGVFARDSIKSTGASLPGGLRVPCLMGEGKREEVIVSSALGGGLDGSATCNPNGLSGLGRFFQLANAPVVPGKTELFLNGAPLYGTEGAVDGASFDGKFSFKLDPITGCIELQSASILDQNGLLYSSAAGNVGNGFLTSGLCGTLPLMSVLAPNTPNERWTVRCVSVLRDSTGAPIPGRATFSLSGSVTGQLLTPSGQPFLFSSGHFEGTLGSVSGNISACTDGYIVADSTGFAVGDAIAKAGDLTPLTTDTFEFIGNLLTQGQALIGDDLCIAGLGYEIIDITYDPILNTTRILVASDTIPVPTLASAWEIKAIDLFIDDATVLHNAITGLPATAGRFSGKDVGKVLQICTGTTVGRYVIQQVTSSRRIRLSSLDNPGFGFPAISGTVGLGESNLLFHVLESNGVLLFGIQEGATPFVIGDRFFVDVSSKVLSKGDALTSRYIAELDLNTPAFFASNKALFAKHGFPSLTNSLSLGAQMSFENGASGMFAVQCKPSFPARTSQNLGVFPNYGGVITNVQADDLTFVIPLPSAGLGTATPGIDSQVNLFYTRNGVETQFFPNKVPFYNSQLETATGQANFIVDTNNPYSYTVIRSGQKIIGQGVSGSVSVANGTFSSTEMNFNGPDVGSIIVVQNGVTPAGTSIVASDDISFQLFGAITLGHELLITGILSDNSVSVTAVGGTPIAGDLSAIKFFVKDPANTTNVSASILLHRDIVSSGTIQAGDIIRASYIDEADANYFDPNWFQAYSALEAISCQMVVPLPLKDFSGIFRAGVAHCENMTSIAIQKERVCLFGAQKGLVADALVGNSLLALENVGILEGIQGDSPLEILSGNTEDLTNYRLSDNFTSRLGSYFYPDEIIRSVSGTNVLIDGFYMAAAAAGVLNKLQNVAIPLTHKVLSGFSIPESKRFRKELLNQLGSEGATVVQPIIGGGQILSSRTTSQSGFVEDEELSIIFIRHMVKDLARKTLLPFVGTAETPNTKTLMQRKIITSLSSLESKGIITGYKNVRVERDRVDPRQWNVFFAFAPAYPINYVFIDIEVGVI